MYELRMVAYATVGNKVTSICSRVLQGADLSAHLAKLLVNQDQLVLEAIRNGQLLADAITIRFEFSPSIGRNRLEEAWTEAVAQLAGVISILPE